MKTYFLLSALLTLSFLIGCQSKSESLEITPEFVKAIQRYDKIDVFSEGLAAVRRDNKWGYINLKGEEVIPCQFSDKFPPGQFSEGLACVVDERNPKEELWNCRIGFINKDGEFVISGDYFSETPSLGTVWGDISHKLPSFKDGKCAVYSKAVYNEEEVWENSNKIILIDKEGNKESAPDSICDKMILYMPFPNVDDVLSRKNFELKDAYNGYCISVYRDTIVCDNDAKLVNWVILDKNDYPYNTHERSYQYFVDNKGNSTILSEKQKQMDDHEAGLMSSLRDKLYTQDLERQRREYQEQIDKKRNSWIYGTWICNAVVSDPYWGRLASNFKLVIDENELRYYWDGKLEYSGSYSIDDNKLRYGGYISTLESNHTIGFGKGNYARKVSSSESSSSHSYTSYTKSQDNFRYFNTEADVWAYLSGRSFSCNGVTIRVFPQYLEINGQIATGGVRVTDISRGSATLRATQIYNPSQVYTMYLNGKNGTILNQGETYYSN